MFEQYFLTPLQYFCYKNNKYLTDDSIINKKGVTYS